MDSFLDFIQFVKLKSINLKDCYLSGDLNCVIASRGQFEYSLLFRSDLTISILTRHEETLLDENCSIDKMKKLFELFFND